MFFLSPQYNNAKTRLFFDFVKKTLISRKDLKENSNK